MWNISHEVYDTYVQTHFLKWNCVEYANWKYEESMISAPLIIIGGLNLKICQNFVGTQFFLRFLRG